MAQGPLIGLRVVELGGIGPAPLACMILADLGADVVRLARAEENRGPVDYTHRGRRIMTADLKSPGDLERVVTLVDHADVLVEGFRPGVTERLGLGPGECLARNPRLVYDTYTCADGRSMAVGCIEPQFFAVAVRLLGLDPVELPAQHDRTRADELRAAFAAAFASKTMAEWTEIFAGTDACVTPVLTYAEALEHEHLRGRATFTEIDGVPQPRPAPRFSRTPGAEPSAPRGDDGASWPPRRPGSPERHGSTSHVLTRQ